VSEILVVYIVGAALFILFIAWLVRSFIARRGRVLKDAEEQREKNEALFRSMFPELQPYYHPARLVEFVTALMAREPLQGNWRWATPAGFEAAAQAEVSPDPKGERVRLVDAAGRPLSEFVFDTHPEGRVLRVGQGKLTVDVRDPKQPRVRYWHPNREFKWSLAGWVFKTPVADEPFESSSSSSGFSSGSPDASRTAATAAGFAGLGGTFDGGGASAGWDGARPGSSPAGEGAAAEGTSAESSTGSGSTSY
jgi:uncharacterized membrane protein YgcG